jgi:hypothetical protein
LPSSRTIFCHHPVQYSVVLLFDIVTSSCSIFCRGPVSYSAIILFNILQFLQLKFCHRIVQYSAALWRYVAVSNGANTRSASITNISKKQTKLHS